MKKKILIINGNPKDSSLCHGMAESYAEGAKASGYDVDVVHLSQLDFEVVLKNGYDKIQELEPDLAMLKQKITDTQHLVFVYPVWWGSVPALLKGVLDRIFLPGFAFSYQDGNPFPKQLLKGRTARLIVTMDTPPWYFKLAYGAPAHKMMRKTVLEFCGVKPVKLTEFGSVNNSKEKHRIKWIEKVRGLGREGR